jgi:hypothetical protein
LTHYEELGIPPSATTGEIRHAHKNLARLLHPDQIQDETLRNLAEGQMKRVNSMCDVLLDPARRRMYDMQLTVLEREQLQPARPLDWVRRNAFWLVATLGAVLGIYSLLQSMGGERVVYVERAQTKAERPPGPKQVIVRSDPEQLKAIARESKELRKMLEEAVRERDQALARLAAVRPAPVDSPPPVSIGIQHPVPPQALPEKSQPAKLAGTWIYTPMGKPSPVDLYPAEYIELVIWERDDGLWGRYRGRYHVTNRAISPEVEFQFQGPQAASQRYVWAGNEGAKGEVHLKLLTGTTMSVDWFTTQPGKPRGLSSGTAVLVRKREE